MNKIGSILAGTGVIIVLYLFLTNGKESVEIINSISSTYTNGIKALQGR